MTTAGLFSRLVTATSGRVSGEMVRDLMSESLEHRFAPAALSALNRSNGCPTTVSVTQRASIGEFARVLGLVVYYASYSPQSNGRAEVFVKTFKPDYVYVNRLPSGAAVIAQLRGWFADYNEIHPTKGSGCAHHSSI